MPRPILDEAQIHPSIRDLIAGNHADLIKEIQDALRDHAVVVVGMGQNPFPKMARKLLNEQGIAHQYLEYGSYLSQWRRRNALKMWTGWPTFPMIFIKGTLIGGAGDLKRLVASGELATLLGSARPSA